MTRQAHNHIYDDDSQVRQYAANELKEINDE
jgi:hypothetical protein